MRVAPFFVVENGDRLRSFGELRSPQNDKWEKDQRIQPPPSTISKGEAATKRGLADPGAGQDHVIGVEDGGLAGSDGALR